MSAKWILPDTVLVTSGLAESDCLIELAVHLYAQRRITVEQARQISQLNSVEFDDAFAKRDLKSHPLEDPKDSLS